MKRLLSLLVLAASLSVGVVDAASAHGRVWAGVSIGVPVYGYGGYGYGYGYGSYGYGVAAPYYGGYAYGAQAPYGYAYTPGAVVVTAPPGYATYGTPVPAAPELIFYPRTGQSPQQTESDRQACLHWAGSQANASTDGSVYRRATLACMEGRGYTGR